MKKTLLFLLALSVALAACGPGSMTPTDPGVPASSETPQAPATPPYSRPPGDVNFSRGEAYIDSVELLTMESFPLQFSLALKGALPTPCNQLRVQVSPPTDKNIIDVQVYSVIDPAMTCTQVLAPFEVNIPLGSFPPGHYEVLVNDGQAAEFDA